MGDEAVKGDILGDAQMRKKGEILPDDMNPGGGGGLRRDFIQRFAVNFNPRAAIRRVNARNNLDQRGLAAAVFTDQTMHLAALQFK